MSLCLSIKVICQTLTTRYRETGKINPKSVKRKCKYNNLYHDIKDLYETFKLT